MTPRAMLRFGELYRNGGRHEGEQIVPEAWVRESLTARAEARRSGEGYGYGWFISEVRGHPMFYAWGYGGQFIFVIPDLELTVVTTSNPDVERERDHLRAVRQILRDGIVPAAKAGAPTLQVAHRTTGFAPSSPRVASVSPTETPPTYPKPMP